MCQTTVSTLLEFSLMGPLWTTQRRRVPVMDSLINVLINQAHSSGGRRVGVTFPDPTDGGTGRHAFIFKSTISQATSNPKTLAPSNEHLRQNFAGCRRTLNVGHRSSTLTRLLLDGSMSVQRYAEKSIFQAMREVWRALERCACLTWTRRRRRPRPRT